VDVKPARRGASVAPSATAAEAKWKQPEPEKKFWSRERAHDAAVRRSPTRRVRRAARRSATRRRAPREVAADAGEKAKWKQPEPEKKI